MSNGRLSVLALLVLVAAGWVVLAVSGSSAGDEESFGGPELRAPRGDDERDAVDVVARYAALGRRGDRRGACALVAGAARREQRCAGRRPRPVLLVAPRTPPGTLRVPEGTDAGEGVVSVHVDQPQAATTGASGRSILDVRGGDGAWRITDASVGVGYG